MKQIGILNFHFGNKNYGAVLQAAALQYFLRKNGYFPQNIDFQPDGSFGNFAKDTLRYLKIALENLYKSRNRQKIDSSAFDSFRSKWINVTKEKFKNTAQLENENFSFNSYIVGSDQVWRNTYTGRAIEAYFFSFVKSKEPIKIAYAASFGVDNWELPIKHHKTNQVSKLIRKIDMVSVREQSGVNICKSIFKTKAELVLDPTLLVGKVFFDEILKDSNFLKEYNYIAVYKLEKDQNFIYYMDQIEKEIGFKSFDIYKRKVKEELYYSSVENWVAMIKDSKLVVTDSFHCCCIAVIYNKPFIYYPPKSNRGMTRIHNIFNLFSLNSVGAIKPDLKKINKICRLGNYEIANSQIMELRAKSSKFLLDALKITRC